MGEYIGVLFAVIAFFFFVTNILLRRKKRSKSATGRNTGGNHKSLSSPGMGHKKQH